MAGLAASDSTLMIRLSLIFVVIGFTMLDRPRAQPGHCNERACRAELDTSERCSSLIQSASTKSRVSFDVESAEQIHDAGSTPMAGVAVKKLSPGSAASKGLMQKEHPPLGAVPGAPGEAASVMGPGQGPLEASQAQAILPMPGQTTELFRASALQAAMPTPAQTADVHAPQAELHRGAEGLPTPGHPSTVTNGSSRVELVDQNAEGNRHAMAMLFKHMRSIRTRSIAANPWFVILVILAVACTCVLVQVMSPAEGKPEVTRDTAKEVSHGTGFVERLPASCMSLSSLSISGSNAASAAAPSKRGLVTTAKPPRTPLRASKDQERSTQAGATRDSSSMSSVICPGLVVPSGCECTLLVPQLSRKQHVVSESLGQVTIDDIKGVPVFLATFRLPGVGMSTAAPRDTRQIAVGGPGRTAAALEGNTCVVLTSTSADPTKFVSCRSNAADQSAALSLDIYDTREKHVGSLRMCPEEGEHSFEVLVGGGFGILLNVNADGEVTATDRRGRSLGTGELAPEQPMRRTVRIGPLVDAGLLTVCIVASDLLLMAAQERAQALPRRAPSSSGAPRSSTSQRAQA